MMRKVELLHCVSTQPNRHLDAYSQGPTQSSPWGPLRRASAAGVSQEPKVVKNHIVEPSHDEKSRTTPLCFSRQPNWHLDANSKCPTQSSPWGPLRKASANGVSQEPKVVKNHIVEPSQKEKSRTHYSPTWS